jgi:ribose-phosphate pyrophosphokinase
MMLYFASCIARELGARRVGLVAPYLAYMRQDAAFNPGECATTGPFGKLLSSMVNWMVTVDPHLHRHHDLAEIYTIPTRVVPAAPAIGRWLAANVPQPLVIGPDSESEQWAGAVARSAGCAFTVLQKVRHGDHEVEVSAPATQQWAGHTPILVDDIASTARTMIAAVENILAAGLPAPVCVAIHPVFAGDAYALLQAAGVARVVSCNTIIHASNGIDVVEALALEAQAMTQ